MFDWLSGRSRESALPETTALQAHRAKQIQQLKIFNQNVYEVQRDVEYTVNCTVNATTISLQITLPSQFPQTKPIVRVSPPLVHPWVDDMMIVTGCPGINNFMVHSDLGKVIREMVIEFRRNPPILRSTIQQLPTEVPPVPPNRYTADVHRDLPSYQTDRASTSTYLGAEISKLLGSFMMSGAPMSSYTMPNVPSSFPQLNDLSSAELKELSEDEDKLAEFMHRLPQIQDIDKDREDICRRNEEQANDNLAKKPVLEKKRAEVMQKFEALSRLREHFDDNSRKQDELRQHFTLEAFIDNLKVAAAQAEEASEVVADKFLDGKCALHEFIQDYMSTRTLAHLRRAKEERLSQLQRDNYRT